MININIHNLVGVGLDNSTAKINSFIKEEFFNFVQNQKLKKNILIKFKSKITIPKNIFRLNKNFYYDPKLKIFYFIKNNKILSYNISGYFKDKIFIEIEKDFNKWFILYIIENTIYVLLSKKKFCMLHAGAVKKGNSSNIILGPQGSGKTFYALDKIKEGYSFLGDEYILLNDKGICSSFPRPINFKKFHQNHYHEAFYYKWKSLRNLEKFKWFFKQIIKTFLLRADWQPMIRLRIGRVYPKTKIVIKTKINKIILKFGNKKKISKSMLSSFYPRIILKNVQFEMINRFISIYKYIFTPKDTFLKKVISDINKLEKSKIKIIKSFLLKTHKMRN